MTARPWASLSDYSIYLSIYASDPSEEGMVAETAALVRRGVQVSKFQLKICEKYSKPHLEEASKSLIAKIAPALQELQISFRYPWTTKNGIELAISQLEAASSLPMVHTLDLRVAANQALQILGTALSKCPNVKTLAFVPHWSFQPCCAALPLVTI